MIDTLEEALERQPPHSIEAEQGVLGCMMLNPAEAIPDCVSRFRGNEEFYDLRHQMIYDVLVRMHDRAQPIDGITIQQQLKDAGRLDSVGGVAYLSTLPDQVPSAANLPHYLGIVSQKATLRRLLSAAAKIEQLARNEEQTESVLDQAEKLILGVSADMESASDEADLGDLINTSLDHLQDCFENNKSLSGIPTGYADLDRMTSGLKNGEVFVIAARPSMGKSSLGLNIAINIAAAGHPVGIFSLEMTKESLSLRALCGEARVSEEDFRTKRANEGDFNRLALARAKLKRSKIIINDRPGLKIIHLRAKARRMFQRHKIKLLVIDYIQLVNSVGNAHNREREVAEISSGIKQLAKELNIPIIVLAQLNREIEKDQNRKPRLADLRESGAIEQDADIVGLLYRKNPDQPAESDTLSIGLKIAKQRNGPTGDIPLVFIRKHTRFESAANVSHERQSDE